MSADRMGSAPLTGHRSAGEVRGQRDRSAVRMGSALLSGQRTRVRGQCLRSGNGDQLQESRVGSRIRTRDIEGMEAITVNHDSSI